VLFRSNNASNAHTWYRKPHGYSAGSTWFVLQLSRRIARARDRCQGTATQLIAAVAYSTRVLIYNTVDCLSNRHEYPASLWLSLPDIDSSTEDMVLMNNSLGHTIIIRSDPDNFELTGLHLVTFRIQTANAWWSAIFS